WRPPMKDPHEVFLSAPDAAELRALLGARVNNKARSHAVEELSALLAHARIVAPERLAADRVAIGSTVTYREEPAGVTPTVALCHPDDADGSLDRLSALSPTGLALLGRRPGSVVMSALPNGW